MSRKTVLQSLVTLYARDLMDAHGLSEWDIHWGDAEDWAGRCYFSAHVICFSRSYLLHTNSAHNVRETILHEIAHALTGDSDHAQIWWDKFKEIGGQGWWGRDDGTVTFSGPKSDSTK